MSMTTTTMEQEKKTGPVEAPAIKRQGKEIILPVGMEYCEARDWLTKQEQAEEKKVNVLDMVPCAPLDGIIALSRAIKELYGFSELTDRPGFWAKDPPLLIQVETHEGFETAAWGQMHIPAWEGGFVTTQFTKGAQIAITGEIKRKFEPQVKELLAMTRRMLRERSIYRGQAIYMDLSFLFENRAFHPVNDAPQFMKLGNGLTLILNRQTQFELSTSLYMLLERSDECRANKINLKHGVLLEGNYGTGKTLTAKVVAHKAISNGWTFIYLKKAPQLAEALRVAQFYAPAVVFAEDIDQVVEGGRDEAMNELLNTLDGVDTKDKEIITVLTTNHPEVIQPAFVRAGRIDTVVRFNPPDSDTCLKFVEMYAKDDEGRALLRPDEDLTKVGDALAGMVPAFICEAVAKAKRFAIYREGLDIVGKMTAEDLVLAGQSIKNHMAMAAPKSKETEADKIIAGHGKWLRDMQHFEG